MSDTYFSGVGHQSQRYNLKSQLKADNIGYQSSWNARASTRWSKELQNELLCFFEKQSYPFRHVFEIPFPDPLRSEIRRFFLSLDAYMESPNPVIPHRELLYGSTYPEFSEYLKRVKRKSFETAWKVEHFDFPDWWDSIPAYKIKDIGDIFNYSYLIFWEEDTDDYLWGFTPLEGKFKKLTSFRECVRALLPERNSFNKIEPIEVISSISSSISYDSKHAKRAPNYKIKNNYLSLSKRRKDCLRSQIRVSPNNCRDSVLNDPSDLNTISLIDQQIMEILRVMPEHIHLRDKEVVSKRYKRLYKRNSIFLHRDIRKEGITKPRILLRVMLEVLHEEYPDIQIFDYFSFYDDFSLIVDGERKCPIRGHGLGMANSLTTLMQLAIHEMNLDELLDDIPELHSEMLCINDDCVVGFRMLEHLEAYWDKEDEIMADLSLLREPTKSFYSYNSFVLAERYFTPQGEYEKTSYQLRECLLPLACANITHAKEYFSSVQTYVNSKLVPKYIEEIYSYWGYEFFPQEFRYPTKVGGWLNEKINSVDMTLKMLDELDFNNMIIRGFHASNVRLHKRKSGKLYTPPIVSLLGFPYIPDEYSEHLNILHESALNDKFGKILQKSPDLFQKYWRNLFLARQKKFKTPSDLPYEELIKMVVSQYETIQFYPSDIMIKQYHKVNIYQGQVSDPYLDPNAVMAMVSKYNSTSYPFKEEFSLSFTDRDSSTKKVSSLFSKEIQRTLKSEVISALTTGKFHEIYYPEGDYRPEVQYLNPIKIGEVVSLIDWGKGYPELREEFISPIIKKKYEVYNHLFTLDELFLISRCKISRERLKTICDYVRNNHGESIKSVINYLCSFVKEERRRKYLMDLDIENAKRPDPFICKEGKDEEHIITMTDLMSENSYKFYIWRQDRKSYSADNLEVQNVIDQLSQWVLYLTHPYLRSLEEKRRIINEDILLCENRIYSLIAQHLGVHKLLDGALDMEDPEGLLDTSDLFGDG